jgi:hypothetical protein
MKVPGKISNGAGVSPDRLVGEVPQPQILNHSLA